MGGVEITNPLQSLSRHDDLLLLQVKLEVERERDGQREKKGEREEERKERRGRERGRKERGRERRKDSRSSLLEVGQAKQTTGNGRRRILAQVSAMPALAGVEGRRREES